MKGALLIALAVVIGFVLLRTAPRNATNITAGSSGGTTPTTSRSPGTTGRPGATSTTTPVAHQPSQVSVLIANGAGVVGLAGRIRGQLNSAGFNTSKPATNAPSQVATTAIYFQPGYEADALAVANTLSLAASNVFSMPSPTPIPASELAGVNVLVIAGSDLAGSGGANTTEAPPGQTIAPSPTVASSGSSGTSSGTSSGASSTTVAHRTTTTVHTSTTVHTTTTTHTTTTARG